MTERNEHEETAKTVDTVYASANDPFTPLAAKPDATDEPVKRS